MTLVNLTRCLLDVPPLELQGTRLLRESKVSGGGWFPQQVPVEEIVAATCQVLHYTRQCRELAAKLSQLNPTPLLTRRLAEVVL